MGENLSFVIPYHGIGNKQGREVLFNFVKKRIQMLFPKSEIIVSVYGGVPFSRSRALNNGVKHAKREVIVMVDADIIFDYDLIVNSLNLLEESPWVVPFNEYCALKKNNTDKILKLNVDFEIVRQLPLEVSIYKHTLGAMNIIRRTDFLKIGGFDERLIDWGFDDNVFAHKADVILGTHKRNIGRVFHLFHERCTSWNNPNTKKNKELFKEISKYKDKDTLLDYLKEKGEKDE